MRTLCFWSLLALLFTLGATADAQPTVTAYALRDVNGVLRRPLDDKTDKAIVLIFVANDCPISNSYAPEINRLFAAYTAKKVAFYLVSVDTGVSAAAVKKHAQQYGYHCPVLLDPTHTLAKHAGATVTPEAAIFSPNGTLLYQGRIDDKYIDWGKTRYQARVHDLRDSLDAVLAGKPVPHTKTKAIGCFMNSAAKSLVQ